jgi:hypothetical protein
MLEKNSTDVQNMLMTNFGAKQQQQYLWSLYEKSIQSVNGN